MKTIREKISEYEEKLDFFKSLNQLLENQRRVILEAMNEEYTSFLARVPDIGEDPPCFQIKLNFDESIISLSNIETGEILFTDTLQTKEKSPRDEYGKYTQRNWYVCNLVFDLIIMYSDPSFYKGERGYFPHYNLVKDELKKISPIYRVDIEYLKILEAYKGSSVFLDSFWNNGIPKLSISEGEARLFFQLEDLDAFYTKIYKSKTHGSEQGYIGSSGSSGGDIYSSRKVIKFISGELNKLARNKLEKKIHKLPIGFRVLGFDFLYYLRNSYFDILIYLDIDNVFIKDDAIYMKFVSESATIDLFLREQTLEWLISKNGVTEANVIDYTEGEEIEKFISEKMKPLMEHLNKWTER